MAAALGYTAANACLRAASDHDAVWVSCVKAFPTVAVFGPILARRLVRGTETLPPWRQLQVLIGAAIIGQLFGNVIFQWSLGVVGMALSVPLTLGTMILAGAVLGRLVLHEPVTMRMAVATVVLIGAIVVLSLGAGEASRAIASVRLAQSPWLVVAGVAAACLSGVAYAMLSAAIRYTVRDTLSIPMTLVTVTLTGLIGLGVFTWARIGLAGMRATPANDLGVMLLAGVFNALAFLALTRSLQLIPLIYVNALNVTQATMAAVAGVMLFSERSSPALWLGVALTGTGLALMQRKPAPRHRPADTALRRASETTVDAPDEPVSAG